MAWFLFLLALAALVPVFLSNSLAIGMCCMFASLVLTVVATMTMLAAHAGESLRHR